MKKAYAILGAISALSLMAVSCQKEVSNVVENAEKVHMTIIASGDAETKTVLQEDGKTVLWDSEENLAVLETIVGAESTNTTYVASSNGVSTDEGNTMTFDVAFDKNTTGSSYTYNAIYPNSSYVTSTNTNPEAFKVITPTTQKATATSFDGDADLLIAKPVTEKSQQTTLNLAFKRMVVVGKMTLNNVQTDGFVKSVKFSSADKVITGKSKLNLTTGEAVEYGYEGTGNRVDYVEVTYAANDIPANGLTVYFTCLPFEIAADEKFTVTLTTKDDKTFTREVTIPKGRKLSFAIGKNTKFSVDMTEATSGENESLAGKNFVIVARHYDTDKNEYSGNYVYLTSTLSSTNTTYYFNGSTDIPATDEINVTNSKVDFPDVTDYWAVEKKGDNYAIKSVSTGKYISYGGSGNSAAQSTDAYELKISAVEGTPGFYEINSVANNTRRLQYNGKSPRFAFYTGTQNDLFLIPVGEDYVAPALESIAVSDVVTNVFFIGDEFKFDGKVTATYADESTKDVTSKASVTVPDMTTIGTKTVTVSYTEGEVTKTTTYGITVNAKPVLVFEKTIFNISNDVTNGGVEYSINNSIDGNLQASCESDADWLTVGDYYLYDGPRPYQFYSAAKNEGAERSGHLTFTYPHADPVVVTIIQAKADDYVEPVAFNVWEDSFSGCSNSTTALTSLSGSTTGFTGNYRDINTTYPMDGAIRVGKASSGGQITTPVLSTITNSSADLTITFKAAGWNGKTAKITLSANSKGTVTEGQTQITSESTMSGQTPSMTGTTYTFHVTGADNTTSITFATTNSIGIDDLVITQTN